MLDEIVQSLQSVFYSSVVSVAVMTQEELDLVQLSYYRLSRSSLFLTPSRFSIT